MVNLPKFLTINTISSLLRSRCDRLNCLVFTASLGILGYRKFNLQITHNGDMIQLKRNFKDDSLP